MTENQTDAPRAANGRGAAFFDLDKTILAKSSSLAFVRPLYKGGLVTKSTVLKSAYGQLVYQIAGADHDQMEAVRARMSELVKGWPVDHVQAIVTETIDGIMDPIVYEEALELIRSHQSAGEPVIVISSSGNEIVEPICERLGVDRAIGTQMQIGEDGKYTGEILFYAYGEGKAEAMLHLAEQDGIDLSESYAYSDSFTDMPMLELVGNPVAVNPDSDLRKVAVEREWPVLDFDKPVAMRARQAAATKAAAGAAGAAVALGLAWYARARGRTGI